MVLHCIHCVYATLVHPDGAPKFYQCGNSKYATADLVDGHKTWPSCQVARATTCGKDATGFLPMVPAFKVPKTSRWEYERNAVKSLWCQRRNLVKPSYWRHYHPNHGTYSVIQAGANRLFWWLHLAHHKLSPPYGWMKR